MTHQEAMAMEDRDLGRHTAHYVRDEIKRQKEQFEHKLAKKLSKRFGLDISFHLDIGRVRMEPRTEER